MLNLMGRNLSAGRELGRIVDCDIKRNGRTDHEITLTVLDPKTQDKAELTCTIDVNLARRIASDIFTDVATYRT